MSITIVSQNELQKNGYVVQTGAGNYLSPSEDITTMFGPGYPIAPIARPEDNDAPRTIDYPVGINYTLTPRVGYGLMSPGMLKATYDSVTEVSNPVNLILRVMSGFTKQLKDPKTGKRVKDGHPFEWITEEPDPLHHIPFNVWMSWFKKSSKIFAAPAFHYHRTNGKIDALEYIDGSTLFLITNAHGYLPEPDEFDPEIMKIIRFAETHSKWQDIGIISKFAKGWVGKVEKWQKQGKPLPVTTPAFTQVIHGITFSFWDKNQIYFMPETPSMITNSPYGETYIERAWTPINTIALMWAFHLGYYRTGNTPEGLLEVPMSMFPTMGKIAQFEREFNARQATGTTTMMSRLRAVPQGTKYTTTKRPDFPKELYAQANTEILYALGVPPSAMGVKSSSGLGSSSRAAGMGEAHDLTQQLIENERMSMQDAINAPLKKAGVDDATFFMDYPQEEVDPQVQAQQLTQEWQFGQKTLNDILTAQDLEPIGNPNDYENNAANFHIRVIGQTAYAVEKMKFDENGMLMGAAPQPGSPENNSPFNPSDPGAAAAQQDGKEDFPPDAKTVAKIMQSIEESGGRSFSMNHATYSLPTITKDLSANSGFDGYSLQSRQPAAPDGVDPAEFAMGMREEQEHAGTVNNDQAVIRNIVLDHLREDKQYYTHLKQVEKADISKGLRAIATKRNLIKVDDEYFKHCGVCPEDSSYFNAPVSNDLHFDFAALRNGHANDIDVVAMTPKGLPPQPALWFPAGGEKISINQKIGGAQYKRREAAYLLDQSLGFHLVPVAYVSEVNGEDGCVAWYAQSDDDPTDTNFKPVNEYAPEWIERAAVFDYIDGEQDRPENKNFITHPNDPTRMICIDNSYSFPADPTMDSKSVFCDAMVNKPLSPETLKAVKMCIGDRATWSDVKDLIGKPAVDNARARAQSLLDNKMITPENEVKKYNPNHDERGRFAVGDGGGHQKGAKDILNWEKNR